MYQPSPLEEAYGIYVLRTEFGTEAPQPGVPHSFRISGRQAVPFLSRSGIDRLILRNVWNTADPTNEGSLKSVEQFHVVLRLVALAQAGLVNAALAQAYQTQQTPMHGMAMCLQSTASQPLNLPAFQDVLIPDNATLQRIYYEYHQPQQQAQLYPPSSAASLSVGSMVAESSNSFQSNVGPAGYSSVSIAKEHVRFPAPAPVLLTSIENAFGSLVDVQDAPLPSLATSIAAPPTNDDVNEDDFGAFEEGPTLPVSSSNDDMLEGSQIGTFSVRGTGLYSDSASPRADLALNQGAGQGPFGGLNSMMGELHLGELKPNGTIQQSDMSHVPVTQNTIGSTAGSVVTSQSRVSISGASGSIENVAAGDTINNSGLPQSLSFGSDTQFPTFGSSLSSDTRPPVSDVFPVGNGAAQAIPAISASQSMSVSSGMAPFIADSMIGSGVTNASRLSITDAFDTVAPVVDKPLPNLAGLQKPPITDVAPNDSSAGGLVEGEDEFGDFKAIEITNDDQPADFQYSGQLPVTSSSDGIDSGVVASSVITAVHEVSGLSPLDGLGISQDLPLPSLEQNRTILRTDSHEKIPVEGNVDNAYTLTLNKQGASPSEQDLWGSVAPVQDMPLPSSMNTIVSTGSVPGISNGIKASNMSDDDDDFGDFVATEVPPSETSGVFMPTQLVVEGEKKRGNAISAHSLGTPYDMGRSDSAYYSAAGMSNISEDIGDYQDTIQQLPREQQQSDTRDEGGLPMLQQALSFEQAGPSQGASDPFSAFDALQSPTVKLPSNISSSLPNLHAASTPSGLESQEMDSPPEDDSDFGDFEGVENSNEKEQQFAPIEDKLQVEMSGNAASQVLHPATSFEQSDTINQDSSDPFSAFDALEASTVELSTSHPGNSSTPITFDPQEEKEIAPGFGAGVDNTPNNNDEVRQLSRDQPQQAEIGTNVVDQDDTDPFSAFDAIQSPPVVLPSSSLENTSTPDLYPATVPATPDSVGGYDAGLTHANNSALNVDIADEDDFGDFDAVPARTDSSALNVGTADEDDFGDFDAVPARTDSSALNVGTADEDDFGDFDAAPARTDSSALNVGTGNGDDFGDFDAAPANTDSSALNVDIADEDDFGDFDAAPARTDSSTLNVDIADEDDFGDFDAAPARTDSSTLNVGIADEDDFGDFDAAPARTDSSALNVGSTDEDDFGNFDTAPTSTDTFVPTVGSATVDDFGDFDATLASTDSSTLNAGTANKNDFGDFDDVPASTGSTALNVGSTDEDDFGDFDTAPASTDTFASADNFGDFDAVPARTDSSALNVGTADEDDFGDFDAAPASTDNSAPIAVNDPPTTVDGDDSFGAFDAAPVDIQVPLESRGVDEDSFGDFDAAPSAIISPSGSVGGTSNVSNIILRVPTSHTTHTTSPSEEEDGYHTNCGDFDIAAIESTPTHADSKVSNVTAPNSKVLGGLNMQQNADNFNEDFDEDFGDFESIPAIQNPDSAPEIDMRSEIVVLASKLPGDLAVINFGQLFDTSLRSSSEHEDSHRVRAGRCLALLKLLTSSNSELVSGLWQKSIGVARDELAASLIIFEQAVEFPEIEQTLFKDKLETYYHGLGEFVRVVRCMVGTVGDLLMMAGAAPFIAQHRKNISLLSQASEVENLWETVCKQVDQLRLRNKNDTTHSLETVEEIRMTSLTSTGHETLCQLTLRPILLDDPISTKSPLTISGRGFLACAGNFLVHKIPSYEIE